MSDADRIAALEERVRQLKTEAAAEKQERIVYQIALEEIQQMAFRALGHVRGNNQ